MNVWSPSGTLQERILKMNKVSQEQAKGILAKVRTKAEKLKPRFLIYGREGVGKTSFPAHMPKPLFLMSRGEDGLKTLVANKQLKEVPHLDEFTDWISFRQVIKSLIKDEHDFETIVLDCLDGFQMLLHDFVRDNEFQGSIAKFNHFRKGADAAVTHFESLIVDLERLRQQRDCTIVMLAHSVVGTRTNPLGIDATIYQINADKKIAPQAKAWADFVLFMNFLSSVSEDGKGTGGTQRICYCNPADGYDAKSRVKMPNSFSLGNTSEEGYQNFISHYKKGTE